tara:strand:+ start:1848 stop:2552 length:705 start_codon:yes stop_codon:yes gene_type:complete
MSLIKIEDEDIHKLLVSGRSYFDILLYNCYDEEKKMIDKEKLNTAFDDLLDNYGDLLNMGIMLSGFQFVGIILEKNLSLTESYEMTVAYFLLSVGFLISMFGVLISFITLEYLRGCRDETVEFIVVGIQKYKWIFKSADAILYSDCIMFTVPINLLIYNSLELNLSLTYNIVCGFLFIIGIFTHYMIIVAKQNYNLTEDDLENNINICNIFNTFNSLLVGEENYKYKRRIYKHD